MEHQHLAIGVGARTDADRGNFERFGDPGPHDVGHPFDHDGVHPLVLQDRGILDQPLRGFAGLRLHLETTEGEHALWGETEVAHDRNFGVQ